MKKMILGVVALVLAAGPAAAHTFGAHGAGAVTGFAHPLAGLDHLLAMVAVGLWASQLGGRALWAVPGAFVGVMALGGLAGMTGLSLPAVELGIAGSVMLLGLLVAAKLVVPTILAASVVGLFAAFHGHAHGVEIPEAALPVAYAAGFIAATALLHLAGIGLGWLMAQHGSAIAVRAAGGAVAAAGIVLLLA